MTTVAAAVRAIAAATPAIEKTARHQQGFMYRPLSEVYRGLRPLMAEHGLTILPIKVEHTIERLPSKSGGMNTWAYVTVDWLLATDEDTVQCQTAGEAMSSLDQAVAVATSYAHKTLLEKMCLIADNSDAQGQPAPRPQQAPAQPQHPGGHGHPVQPPPPQQPPPPPPQAAAPPAAKPAGSVMLSKFSSKGTSTGGTRYSALGDDNCWYATFSDEIGENMRQCVEQGLAVAVEFTETKYGRDIITLMPAWGPPDPSDTPPPAQQQAPPPPQQPPAEPAGPPPLQVSSAMITGVTQEPVTLNNGGTGVLYRVQTSNGNYGTFDERTGKVAQDLINQRATFHYRIEPRGNYLEKLEPLAS